MIPWTITQSTPVIAPGQIHGKLDAQRAGAAHVVRLGDTLRMVYWGAEHGVGHHLLAAEAPVARPNDWRPLGPLLSPQPETIHNSVGPAFPFLLPVTADYWLLYFCCWGAQPGRRLPNTTGVAISENAGRTWRYHPGNPMLPMEHPWDREGTGSLWVLHEGGRFRCYYTAIGRYFPRPEGVTSGHGDMLPDIGIALAESRDGIHWEAAHEGLVVAPRGLGVEPYEYICSKPAMIVNDSGIGPRYTLWVNTFGLAYRIHRLTSDDGVRWTWAPRVGPEGELGTGAPGAFDDHQRSYPTMVVIGDTLHCWFTGNKFGLTGMGHATHPWPA